MKNFFNDLEYFSDATVFSTMSEEITYERLLKDIEKCSLHFKSRSLVILLCENTIESVIGYLSCLRSGVVPLLISSSLDEELLLELMNSYKPNFIWTSRNLDSLNEKWKMVHSNRTYQLLQITDPFEHSFHNDLALYPAYKKKHNATYDLTIT